MIKPEENNGSNSQGITPKDIETRESSLEKYPMLNLIHDRTARLFRLTISSKLRKITDVKVESTDVIKFKELKEATVIPSLFWLSRIDPFDENAILCFPPETVFTLIDLLFGGTGNQKVKSMNPDYTAIEVNLIKSVVLWFLNDLEQAWKPIHPVQLTINRAEINPKFIHTISESDEVVMVKYRIEFDKTSNTFTLIVPFSLLQNVKEELKDESALTKKGRLDKAQKENSENAESDPIKTIQGIDSKILSELIRNEHPQTIALVISVLDSAEKACHTLLNLPEDLKSDIIYRIANMNSVSISALDTLEAMVHEAELASEENHQKLGGIEFTANILKTAGEEETKSILSDIKKNDAKVADTLSKILLAT